MNLTCKIVKEILPLHRDLLFKINHICGVDAIVDNVLNGGLILHEVLKDDVVIGIFGNNVDTLWDGRKLLIHQFTATADNTEPFGMIAGMFEEIIACKAGINTIRLHTNTEAAGRFMERRLGYKKIETVYEKVIADVGQSE